MSEFDAIVAIGAGAVLLLGVVSGYSATICGSPSLQSAWLWGAR